jgi:chromosome segregation protein
MEDVIFGGSEVRKPTASAEVRLLLAGVTAGLLDGNGGDEHEIVRVSREVEVTRRLYRSGESEYLINGDICRLRDVHDLLMDTGLGAKAYAIIEQGKIGMILSTRPADRRQLIEEAAGVTKYKARRRAAELKLEASQQNLTRIEDVVYEVEKQRGQLKRQAARARRYRRLREELRQWEKVLVARKYRELSTRLDAISSAFASTRFEETIAEGRVAELETALVRIRLELAEAASAAASRREAAHACEMEIDRKQTQITFDRQQISELLSRGTDLKTELGALDTRREPARIALEGRREAAAATMEECRLAAEALREDMSALGTARQRLETLEGDVEEARRRLQSILNSATALRHVIESAGLSRRRVLEELGKLDAEAYDLHTEGERARAEQAATSESLSQARMHLDELRLARAGRESELAATRGRLEEKIAELRAGEQRLAGLEARLKSLEELEMSRAGYDDAAKLVLAENEGSVRHLGSVADYLEVESRYERAVESCLGSLLQHVVVESHHDALAGLQLVKERKAGRCGFLVIDAPEPEPSASQLPVPAEDLVPLLSVVRVAGPAAEAIRRAIGEGWIAPSFDEARRAASVADAPVATEGGDVFLGSRVSGGAASEEARGILAIKREIRGLRDRLIVERDRMGRLSEEVGSLQQAAIALSDAINVLGADQHQKEKEILGLELRLNGALEDTLRLSRKAELVETERRGAAEELRGLEARELEATESVAMLQDQQREAEEELALAQRTLLAAREVAERAAQRAADAGAAHAALIERSAALSAEVARLEEASQELEARVLGRMAELERTRQRTGEVEEAVAAHEAELKHNLESLDGLRLAVRQADDLLRDLQAHADGYEDGIRQARRELDEVRTRVKELEVAQVGVQSDMQHLAQTCVEALQSSLEAVVLEADNAQPVVSEAAEGEEEDESRPEDAGVAHVEQTPEQRIAFLKEKIDRLGPVNMMAIEQFDELEERHRFLTSQRADLDESIASTREAIKRIDETTKRRLREAFEAININFQESFTTLFGGGSAGLSLLDENDLLESGIEVEAQPPGKRLQNVQLLSGGEKALTAIALMFAIFRYKPSPFCVLDEIDAPLDDANIGRFLDMLRSMQGQTQFILITHNRKTMEIADRLYGVTMEEPGVSKLISVKLN